MDDVLISSTILSFIMNIIMTSVFAYLWFSTRRRHLFYWTLALPLNGIVLVCTAFRLSYPSRDALLRVTIDTLAGIASSLVAMGAVTLAKRDVMRYRRWFVVPAVAVFWSAFANQSGFHPVIGSVPVFAFVGFSIMGAGLLFFRSPELSHFPASPYVGTCMIIWGALNGTYPITLGTNAVSDLGHYAAAACALMTGMFMMVVSVQEFGEQTENERERLSVTLSSIGDAVIAVDTGSKVTVINPVAQKLTGWSEAEALGKDISEVFKVINEETLAPADSLVDRVLAEGSIIGLANHTALQSRDGVEYSIADNAAPIHAADGSVEGVILVFRDVTKERKQERALRQSEARFRLIADHTSDVIFRLKLAPLPRFDYLSPAIIQVTGFTPEEIYSSASIMMRVLHPEDASLVSSILEGKFNFERPFTLRWNRSDGAVVWTEQRGAPVFDADGALVAIDGIARDVTEQKIMEEQLKYVSLHDPLTGLYNRAYFEEEMRRLDAWMAAERPVSIISTDVNGLKLINDTMGHKKGDDLLKAYASVLSAAFKGTGMVARIGGDEFSIICRRTDEDDAALLLKKLDDAISAHNQEGPETPLSVSMGSATAADPEVPLEDVLNRADKAMYNDKLRSSASAKSGIVKGLLAALAAKDYVAEGHVSRVTKVACRLGEALGLSKKEMSDLALLGEVHDLGKVGIPDRILFKPGPLDPIEREEMKQHSAIGYRIAKASMDLSHVANLILHHHEWWNGQGYPSGLEREDIPLHCRILAIADAFDAMLSERPYKKPKSTEEAVAELRRCAGTQFDPALVEKFIVEGFKEPANGIAASSATGFAR